MRSVKNLDSESTITAGGWDPRYAVALAVVSAGDIAAALVDTNGDGADIDIDQYSRDDSGAWVEVASSSAGDHGTSMSAQMVTAHGRTAPGGTVHVEYNRVRHAVTSDSSGWWLFIAPSVDEHTLVRIL